MVEIENVLSLAPQVDPIRRVKVIGMNDITHSPVVHL